RLIVQVQRGELFPGLAERLEIRPERDAWQFPLQVVRILSAIPWMVEQAIHVIEDRPLVNLLVLIMIPELFQCPVRDILSAVSAIFIVDIEVKTLRTTTCPY